MNQKQAFVRGLIKLAVESREINLVKLCEEQGLHNEQFYNYYNSEDGAPMREKTLDKYMNAILPYVNKRAEELFFLYLANLPIYLVDELPKGFELANPIVKVVPEWIITSLTFSYGLAPVEKLPKDGKYMIVIKSANQIWLVFS